MDPSSLDPAGKSFNPMRAKVVPMAEEPTRNPPFLVTVNTADKWVTIDWNDASGYQRQLTFKFDVLLNDYVYSASWKSNGVEVCEMRPEELLEIC